MKSFLSHAKSSVFSLAANDYNLRKKLNSALKNDYLIVLNFHRVAPFDGSSWKPLDPIIFRELISFISKNFEVTTFQGLRTGNLIRKRRPKLIMSFDDGYKDFLEYAVPILSQFKFSVNQNIIPNCSVKNSPPLNVIAQDWIGKAPMVLVKQLDVPGFEVPIHSKNRVALGGQISKFLKTKPYLEQVRYLEYLLPQFLDFEEFKWTQVMSLSDIQEILPLHEIGLHSMNHENMDQETDEYFKNDLRECLDFATTHLNNPNPIYAFPNGAFRENQIGIIESSGFNEILLVGDCASRENKNVHNRFNFYADSVNEAIYKSTGSLLSLKSTFKI
jgi:peptidoglycan/xylan/chitin deacetylase (PgdA/CDA1 family)